MDAQRENRQALETAADTAASAARDLAGADHQCRTSKPGSCNCISETCLPIQRATIRSAPSTVAAAVETRVAGNTAAKAGSATADLPLIIVIRMSLRVALTSVSKGQIASGRMIVISAGAPATTRPADFSRRSCAAPVVTVRANPSGLS